MQDPFRTHGCPSTLSGLTPLNVFDLPRMAETEKVAADDLAKVPSRPRHWDSSAIPWRWHETLPEEGWGCILNLCRGRTVLDFSLVPAWIFFEFASTKLERLACPGCHCIGAL